jgi:hypothetical protein
VHQVDEQVWLPIQGAGDLCPACTAKRFLLRGLAFGSMDGE